MKRAMQGSGVLLMKITVNFTVHIYAEERLCDELLIPHSENYGIVGEEIIEPLRIINNRSIMFEVENSVSIKEFYQLIEGIFTLKRIIGWICMEKNKQLLIL